MRLCKEHSRLNKVTWESLDGQTVWTAKGHLIMQLGIDSIKASKRH